MVPVKADGHSFSIRMKYANQNHWMLDFRKKEILGKYAKPDESEKIV
jgi:hypothetical protein